MGEYLGLIELVGFSALMIGFGLWQLRSLDKLKREREAREKAERDEAP